MRESKFRLLIGPSTYTNRSGYSPLNSSSITTAIAMAGHVIIRELRKD
jgi:hypothetical protein